MKTDLITKKLNPIRNILWLFLLLLSTAMQAQSPSRAIPTDVKIVSDPDTQKIHIEVSQGQEIINLLVLVVDDSGHTVYLDDKSHFKGTYISEVDLKKEGRGMYDLKIIADKEEIRQKVVMR